MPTLQLSNASPRSLRVDAIVVGLAKGSDGPVLAPGAKDVDRALRGRLVATLVALGATGAAGEVTKVSTVGDVPLVVAGVGLGDAPAVEAPVTAGRGRRGRIAPPVAYDLEVLRRAAGDAVRALAGSRRVALALPAGNAYAVAAVAEGALLGAYDFTRFRTTSMQGRRAPVEELTVLTPGAGERAVKAAATRAAVVAESVTFTRDLVNTPPDHLPPAGLAEEARRFTRGLGIDATVLDEKALAKQGYGGITGVGQGSANPPRLVKLTYRGPRARRHLALVGKGITFDSGGLSLKPPKSMETMKSDMGGAAAVIAAIAAIAKLRLPVDVTAWAPLAENMPSGTAQRPSDVRTMYGGKTVEVLNTDAEGRLVLADALVAASGDRPDLIVDAATLTGAQLVALGARTAGIMANDDDVRARVHDASRRAGEAMWPMPLPEELRKSMDSEVADIANIGDRNGGMLVAGLFLKEFVGEGLKWAHLDIAGPAFNDGTAYGYTPKGGTGAGVRTLVQVAEDLAEGRF